MKQEYSPNVDVGAINYRIERSRLLIREKNMRGKSLTKCLIDIAYFDGMNFTYPLSLDEFSNFVQSWMDQNHGVWKFNNPTMGEDYPKIELTEKQYGAKTLTEFLKVSCSDPVMASTEMRFKCSENELAKQIRYKVTLFQGIDLHA